MWWKYVAETYIFVKKYFNKSYLGGKIDHWHLRRVNYFFLCWGNPSLPFPVIPRNYKSWRIPVSLYPLRFLSVTRMRPHFWRKRCFCALRNSPYKIIKNVVEWQGFETICFQADRFVWTEVVGNKWSIYQALVKSRNSRHYQNCVTLLIFPLELFNQFSKH